MPDMDFRSMVANAYAEAEGAETETQGAPDNGGGEAPETPAVDVDAAPAGGVESIEAAAADNGGDAAAAKETAAAIRARDEKGKFTKAAKVAAAKSETKAPASGDAPSSTGEVPPIASGDSISQTKPPQSLTPQERDVFARAPPEIQKALLRIDQTAKQALQESAPARRFTQEIGQTFGPIAQAHGVQIPQLLQDFAQASQGLLSNDQGTKARVFAGLMHRYGLQDMDALIGALNNPQAAPPQAQQRPVDPEEITRRVEQRMEQKYVQRQADTELRGFMADKANEFLAGEHGNRVLAHMHASIRAAEGMGEELSLKDAYDSAIWGLPQTRAILNSKVAAERAKAAAASTQQARNAAVSVKSAPSTASSSAPKASAKHRDIVAAAWETLEGG